MTTTAAVIQDWLGLGLQVGGLGLAVVAGYVGLSTYRKNSDDRREEARRRREEHARSVFAVVREPHTYVAEVLRDPATREEFDPSEGDGWHLHRLEYAPGVEECHIVQTTSPTLRIDNHGKLPITVECARLVWSLYVTDGSSGIAGHADGVSISLGVSARFAKDPAWVQHWTPTDRTGGIDRVSPWGQNQGAYAEPIGPGETLRVDLADEIPFTVALHRELPVPRPTLAGVGVELDYLTLVDAFGQRWKWSATAVEEFEGQPAALPASN